LDGCSLNKILKLAGSSSSLHSSLSEFPAESPDSAEHDVPGDQSERAEHYQHGDFERGIAGLGGGLQPSEPVSVSISSIFCHETAVL
jgi:hypothetical protein